MVSETMVSETMATETTTREELSRRPRLRRARSRRRRPMRGNVEEGNVEEDTDVEDTGVEKKNTKNKDTKLEDTKLEDTKLEDTKLEDTKLEGTKLGDEKLEDKKHEGTKEKTAKDRIDGTYPDRKRQHRQLVGYVSTFSNPLFDASPVPSGDKGCKNCLTQSREGARCRAQIPLNGALLARAKRNQAQSVVAPRDDSAESSQARREYLGDGIYVLPSLDKEAVVDYLKEYLHWFVEMVGGTRVDIPQVDPFVEVAVYYRDAKFGDPDPSKIYTPVLEATQGKRGGAILST
ncbi:hypothetical protein B0J18DRAFT_258899 [Chaetomium sp. MPI-SDFR-AT-0129]|nr:hypothetical protein B0J18DRAFT_258899 [Chaetomium sp. MPI-SDFR-AT-0129]